MRAIGKMILLISIKAITAGKKKRIDISKLSLQNSFLIRAVG